MSTFRTALRVVAGHPIYLVLYVVFLSLMGVFVVGDMGTATAGEKDGYAAYEARVAVVDRDGTALSCALAAWAGDAFEVVEVADEPLALQDAVATGQADCLVVLPEGFERELLDAARAGGEVPALEVAYGQDVQAGALAAQAASRWVSLAAAAAALEPQASASEVADLALVAAAERAEVSVRESEGALGGADRLATYLNFSTYSVMSSIVVVAGVSLAAFQRPELRRRTAAGPVSPARLSAGQVVACLVLAVAVWAWTCAVALASSAGALAGTDPALVACALGSVLPFALVPLALAFLLAQLGLSEDAVNACGNIGAMVLSFLGGAWVPLSMLPEAVQAAARLSPSYWVSQAVASALHAEALTPELAAELGTNLGIVLLFAVTLFAVGLSLGRARRRAAGAA
ncbi:ABC transporter permease [Thermophilibacter provencensis]|uniref:ABC transporter permease n=1 Tax=Thermophilibacter provencensis TaxID=1852386 RepID=UPI002943AE01|nr:ABC transporter permease [Thermophilibacter provencensis]